MSLDLDILRWLSQHRTPALTTVARWAMDMGADAAVIAVAGLAGLIVVVVKRWWWQGIMIAVAAAVAVVTAGVFKVLIQRARPSGELVVVEVGGFSMPSTVAAMTAAVVVATYLALPWSAKARGWVAAPLAVIVGLIGLAMVYLGAHWPTDVLAGWAVGAGAGAAVVSSARVALRLAR
ncbi:phosphatase PAP2 family protein [Nocardia sp. CDC159]|uniref:Phosphatase PAP2 family protein n=1 Tax=Nocardia pulmonis TaxID=2951408 RepID=A0A9X2E907_9NOCA|nr:MULTISPECIES: phosphatase PAP2 family protein [Nocardia]MCM6773926.1 phosphatase PAP2 family protein [Nocardia pulmonis]MCM6786813.1 phosphatase PAP2 family protein [Nocardia sp. CDC159]